MSAMTAFKDAFLTAFFRVAFFISGWMIYLLPGRVRIFLGNRLGELLQGLRLREKIIRENLLRAFGGDSAEARLKREVLLAEAYRHLGNLIFEFFFVFGPMRTYVRRRTQLEGSQYWIDAKKAGKGVIFLAGHVGNWEIMGAVGGQTHFKEMLFVTKKLKPSWFHRVVESARASYGVAGTYEPRTLKDVLGALKKNRTVGFVQDQYVGPPTGIRVPFFGVPVGTSRVVASLAKRTGAAVLPVSNRRLADGTYCVVIEPPVQWLSAADAEGELRKNTALYTKKIEGHILANPGQWLWSHRRFKGDLGPLRSDETDSML